MLRSLLALWFAALCAQTVIGHNVQYNATGTQKQQSCRDRFLWPFSQNSIWNHPIGSNAVYAPGGIYHDKSMHPTDFHNDQDFFLLATENDPLTPWLNQGWWGARNHCDIITTIPSGYIHFPSAFTTASDGGRSPPWQSNNNAMGVLLPDNRTLVQMQPIYRCHQGGPILAKWGNDTDGCPQNFPNVTDITGDGALGAHGGSGLSSVGGTIRVGELHPDAPPISHALKVELSGAHFYYGVAPLQPKSTYNGGRTQYVWPATGSDSCSPPCYKGTNPHVAPGALLAIPPSKADSVNTTTVVGGKIKAALIAYGGYIVDDTGGGNSGAICMEGAVNDEMRSLYGYAMTYPNGVQATGSGSDLYEDLLNIFQALEAVTNNSPTSIGGGGTPLAPLAPPICGES